jgi:hypothetical protein
MTPVKWVIVTLTILGLAGLMYWLLSPKSAATTNKLGNTGALGFLGGLFAPATTTTTTTYLTTPNLVVDPGTGGDNFPGGTYVPPVVGVDGGDKGGGNYTSNPSWQYGEYGAISGNDFLGNSFVTLPAPIIPFEVKARPYTFGIDYPFAEQTARGIVNFRRFPEFSLSDNKIHVSGPWYSDAYANAGFSRGITSITTFPNFRTAGAPQSIIYLPRHQKNDMIGDPVFHEIARSLVNDNPNSPHADAWRDFGYNQRFTLDEGAYVEIGRQMWLQEQQLQDANNQGVMYLCVDLESTHPFDYVRHAIGWIYMGLCGAAAQDGMQVIPYLYSTGTQTTGVLGFSDRMYGTGDPLYLADEHDFLAGGDPLLQAMKLYNGVITVDTYIQAICGPEDMLERDESGNIYTDGEGKPIFTQRTQTTVFGVTVSLEPDEARRAVQDLYEQSTRLYLMNHRLAGGYPAYGGQRRESMIGVQSGSFTRNTQEGVDGIVQNDRPVPAWQMDLFNAINLFLSNHTWCWSVDFNHEPDQVGSDHTNVVAYQAHGPMESLIRAMHRHSAFSQIQTSAYKWCWFNLAMVNNMRGDGNSYAQKAIMHAKIRNVNGTAWLEALIAFPCTDGRPTRFRLWVDKNGVQSEPFECWLQNGRSYFYDAWPLPSDFSYDQLEGADIYGDYLDVQNVDRYVRGDYRASLDGIRVPVSQAQPTNSQA